jgi:hypothetical protein
MKKNQSPEGDLRRRGERGNMDPVFPLKLGRNAALEEIWRIVPQEVNV